MPRGNGTYNKIFTKDKWDKVNSDNKNIVDDFIMEYKQQKKSDGTIKQYYNDLRIILIKIMEDFENKSILEMTKKDFRRLNLWFDESGMSPARCNRLHSACNSLLTFCEEDDDYEYDINTSKKVKGLPKQKVKIDDGDFFFTFDEFIKVRQRLLDDGDYQTAAMWSLAFDSGARRNEVYQVVKHGLLDGNKTNIVVGKRGKRFPLFYLNDTKEIIRQYLDWRGDDNIDSLWISGRGETARPVNSEALYNRISKCNKILSELREEETNIFFHTCRHSRIECLVQGTDDRLKDENGNNKKFSIDQVQVFVHHESADTTMSYCKDHSEEIISSMFNI